MGETTTTQSFVAQFGANRAELPGGALPWLNALREEGIDRFAALGLPTPRQEAWKYTNLRSLEKADFRLAPQAPATVDRLPTLLPGGEGLPRVVFVNGRHRPELSTLGTLPEGVELTSLAETLERDPDMLAAHLGRTAALDGQAMLALNTALMTDGLVLRVKAGVTVDVPIESIAVGVPGDGPTAYHPRHLIVMEPGSRATIIEHHAALETGVYFANGVTEIDLGAGARLHHYKVQDERPASFHLSTVHVEVGRDAFYEGFALTKGARLARNEISVRLAAEGAECHLNGAYMLRGEQHCDNTTVIDHLAPHTSSREVFKGVIDDRAHAVFQGRIVVHRDAQKSDGHQLSKALLLSDRAEIDTKPELEIYADDVKCSHGATAGDLDREALFYLRSRGIPEPNARDILIEAFLGESIHSIAAEGLCPALMTSVGHWLSSTGGREDR